MSDKIVTMQARVHDTGSLFQRMLGGIRNWNARRLAKAELASLPTYLLNDIGIRREMIDEYVDGSMKNHAFGSADVVKLDVAEAVHSTTNQAKAA